MSGSSGYEYRGTKDVDKGIKERLYKDQLKRTVSRPDIHIMGKHYDGMTGKEIKKSFDWTKVNKL